MSAADFDVILNRLLTEIMLAEAGKDEGMIPVYALLSEWQDLGLKLHPAVEDSRRRAKLHLDQLLDAAEPWKQESIDELRAWLQWCENCAATPPGEDLEPFDFSFDMATEAAAEVGEAASTAAAEPAEEAEIPQRIDLASDPELLTEFLAEANEHLEVVEQQVLTLENDPTNAEGLAAVFRAYHTIKGVAGFLQLESIQRLAHEVESLLDLARNKTLTLDGQMISLILTSRDSLKQLTDQIDHALTTGEQPTEAVPVRQLIQDVKRTTQAALSGDYGAPKAATAPKAAPAPVAEAPKPAPTVAAQDVAIPAPAAKPAPAEEPEEEDVITEAITATRAPIAAKAANLDPDEASQHLLNQQSKRAATIRVDYEKVSNLMDMVGELVIVESQLTSGSESYAQTNPHFQRMMNQLKRITKDLQHTSMALRLVPIKPSFQKVARMVRDLSIAFGKKVEFTMSGEETELDRSVVEQIADPLVHMVRNAIDHGLEPDEQTRVQAGKPAAGTISLRAYQLGSSIVIELSDDGRGLNAEKILKKARERGIVDRNAEMTKEEIHQLIFLPGFSTADKVTDISGRGVGMDVVRRNIEALRGTVQVVSNPGHGTTFKIKLPLTTAIIDGLVVRVGNERFVLPTNAVRQTIRPNAKQLRVLYGKSEVVVLRDNLAPVIRLYEEFGIEGAIEDPTKANLVIIETFGKQYAMLVDEMIHKQEVVIKSLGAMMRRVRGVSGGAILGDGTIALILDPFSIVAAANDLQDAGIGLTMGAGA